MSYLHLFDILDKILQFLNPKDVCRLMMVDKKLLKMIGSSNIWIKDLSINKDIWNSPLYQNIKSIIRKNPIIESNILLRKYYSDHYYFFRYYHLGFDGYLKLSNILQSSQENLQKFREMIIYHYKINNKREIREYDLVTKNIEYLKDVLKSVSAEITENIVFNPKTFSHLMVNMDNNFCDIKICSNIGWHKFGRRKSFFCIPCPWALTAKPICFRDLVKLIGADPESIIDDMLDENELDEDEINENELDENDLREIRDNLNQNDDSPYNKLEKEIEELNKKRNERIDNDKYGDIADGWNEKSDDYNITVKEYFTMLSKRVDIDPFLLYINVLFIFRAFDSLKKMK